MAARKGSIEGEIDKDPDGPRVQSRQAKVEQVEPNDKGEIELDLGDEDEGDDDDDASSPEPQRQNSRQRRASNYRETREKADRLERENEQLRQGQQQLQNWAMSQQQPQQQQQNPGLEEAKRIFTEQEDAYAAFKALEAAGALDGPAIQKWKDRFQDIEIRKAAALARANGMGPQQQLTPQQVIMLQEQGQLMQRYGDVLNHSPQARQYALATHAARVAAGERDSESLRDDVAEEVRKRFNLPSQMQRPAPSQNNRRKYTGMSAGAGGARPDTNKVTFSKEDLKMAKAMYPKMNDKEALRTWHATRAKTRARQQSG